MLRTGWTAPVPFLAFRPTQPFAQRFRRAANLARNRADRRPLRFVLPLVLQNQADRPLADFR